MADVKDILGVPRGGAAPAEEKAPAKKEKVKRPEGMSREAFALLGASHPIISSQLTTSSKKSDLLKKPKPSTKGIVTYQYRTFTNSARTDGLELSHWLKCYKGANGVIREPDETEYPYAKYNKKVQLVKYDDEEYDSLVRPYDTGPNSGGWTREETDYLYDLCEQLDLRWHVIWDRYEWPPGSAPPASALPPPTSPPGPNAWGGAPNGRTLEDLKERYYSVARRVLVGRQGGEAGLANNPLVKTPFAKAAEADRKKALAALLARTPAQIAEEHAILAEARAVEEKRKAEANAARRAAATAAANTAAAATAAAAAPRNASPAQPPRATPGAAAAAAATPAATPAAAAMGGPPGSAAAAAAPRALSPAPALMSSELRHPPEFDNAPPPGVPSLFDADVRPYKPKPGVYLRGAHTHAMAAQQAGAMTGGSRAFKAVEATLAELPCPTATTGPRVMTRATSGMWLALRAETIALHETRRGLTNRIHGDGGADRTGGARRPEKRRRP